MVTGKLKPEESASLAVHREIREETGLTARSLYVDVTMFYDQSKNRIAFSANFCAFASYLQPVILSSKEHDQYKWCTLGEALNLLAFPAQKKLWRLLTSNMFYKSHI